MLTLQLLHLLQPPGMSEEGLALFSQTSLQATEELFGSSFD